MPSQPFSAFIERRAIEAASGQMVTATDLSAVTAHIAGVGFSQSSTRAGGRLAGLAWKGSVLSGGDMLPNAEAHYLRHCIANNEWPVGTTLSDYLASLQSVVTNSSTRVFVSRYQGLWQVGFADEAGQYRGPQGNRWILVEYRCSVDGWVTGFQPNAGLASLVSQNRSYRTWLKRL